MNLCAFKKLTAYKVGRGRSDSY